MKRQSAYVLYGSVAGCDRGIIEAVFKTQQNIQKYLAKEYPDARGKNRKTPKELYWEGYDYWLKAKRVDCYSN